MAMAEMVRQQEEIAVEELIRRAVNQEATQEELEEGLKLYPSFAKFVEESVKYKWKYYIPIGVGEEFIKLYGSGDYFTVAFFGANGVGKTTLMINMLAQHFFPSNNKYFRDVPLFKKFPFKKRGRIVADPTTIRQTIIPALKEWFPEGRYETKGEGKPYEYKWYILDENGKRTGWEFDLMTYDQSPKEFESSTLGWTFFDEPPPQSIYTATVARMRKGGIIAIFATPLSGSAWMYDEFVANPDLKKKFRAFVEADVEQACKKHGKNGFLEHDNIVKMIRQYSPEERHARVLGKFAHLTGLVFKKWNRKVHVIPPFHVSYNDYVVVQSWDSHPRVPEAISWVAIDNKGRHFIVDEIFSDERTDTLVAKVKEKDEKYRVVKRILEPASFDVDKRTGLSWASILLDKYGLYYEPASKRRADGIKLISDYLDYQVVGGEFLKPPILYCVDYCTRHIFEFEHWQWDDWKGKTADEKSLKQKPKDKDDHAMEALGRILLEGISYSGIVDKEYVQRRGMEQGVNDDPYD